MAQLYELVNPQLLKVGIGTFVLAYAARLLINYRNAIASINNHPGHRAFLSHQSIISRFFPYWKYFNGVEFFEFWNKYQRFEETGLDIISVVSVWPNNALTLLLADPDAIKEVVLNRPNFPKPTKLYATLSLFGGNIIASEHDEWRKHRKVASPAFSERNSALVFQETTRIVLNLFQMWKEQGKGNVIAIPDMTNTTFELALQVIASAAFGYSIAWKDEDKALEGHKMTFKGALSGVCHNLIPRMICSDRILSLWERGRKIKTEFEELEVYMREMIQERRDAEAQGVERADVFTNLLNASESEKGDGGGLSDSELNGDIFILLLAGHETTSHALAFAFAALAVHPEIQQKALDEVRAMVPEGQLPSYSDVVRFTYIPAIFNEALRMFPPVAHIPKESAFDTTLRTKDRNGETVVIPCPKGTQINLSAIALHFNPKYWHDPNAFNPDRFLGYWNRDAFLPFSAGARSCIGRRFAEIESVTTLALMVMHYEISVTENPRFVHETWEQRRDRVMGAFQGTLTITPMGVPLTFKRRVH